MSDRTTALSAYIAKAVGGRFFVQATTVTVGTTATKIVDHNFSRMGLVIINTGSQSLSFLPTLTPTTTNGVILGASGGNASMDAIEDLALVGNEFYGVSFSATTTVTVIEIIQFSEGEG